SARPPDLVAVGDSITQGQYAPFSWVSLLPIWKKVASVNQGISGQTTVTMRERFPDALATGAKIVVLMGGTNDLAYHLPVRTTLANIAAMAGEAQALKRRFVLVGP